MAYFRSKEIKYKPRPIPPIPPYVPPTPPTPPTPEDGNVPVIPRPFFSESTTLHLYMTSDENNKLDKNLLNEITMDIIFKDDTSAINPSIVIETDVNLTAYNYAKIDITGRYYFIESVEMLTGNMFRVILTVDVLMSFKEGIKSLNGVISRTQDIRYANLDYDDGSFINQNGTWKEIKEFGTPAFKTDPYNVLIVAGGGN